VRGRKKRRPWGRRMDELASLDQKIWARGLLTVAS